MDIKEKDWAKLCYDEHVKSILSHRRILAHILNSGVREYQGCTVEETMCLIEPEMQLGSMPVITGDRNEDTVSGEGRRVFDIRFHAHAPSHEKLLFDVEAQKKFYPGYHLVTRGVFYVARMVSVQLGTEFTGSDYDEIKKVYSIWVCMDAPCKKGNTTTEYRLQEFNIKGSVGENPKNYDKMSVIMICLNEDVPAQPGGVHHLLNTLFSTRLSLEEKKEILINTYDWELETDFETEVRGMCNWSDAIEERGIRRGIEQGENYFALLTGYLLRDSKTELLQKVLTDRALRNELYKEYGIVENLS